MTDYDEIQAKKDVSEFFWTVLGPTVCQNRACGQQLWRDQTKFYTHRDSGGLFARCIHCDTLHRFSVTLA